MRYHREDPDSVLIIVGGHGNDYQKICERVHELDDLRIILIRNLSNPLISILMWQTYRFDMTTVFKQGKRYMTMFGDGIVLRMW